MRILCVSDMVDPLVYSSNAKERYGKVDLVLSCGDLPHSYYEFILSTLNKPLYYVSGNHDRPQTDTNKSFFPREYNVDPEPYFGENIDGKVVRDPKTGLLIAGLGGSMRYNNGENQYTEVQMRRRINSLVPRLITNKARYGRALDILITHAPPFGIHDEPDPCHMGFACFNSFIERFQPRWLLHGHVHLIDENQRPFTEVNACTVINIYKNFLLDTEK